MSIINRDFRAINVSPDTIKRLVNIIEENDDNATYVIKRHEPKNACSTNTTLQASVETTNGSPPRKPNALVQLPQEEQPQLDLGTSAGDQLLTSILNRKITKIIAQKLLNANGNGVSYDDLGFAVVSNGYKQGSVSPAITMLAKAGLACRYGYRRVILTDAGRKTFTTAGLG